MNEAIQFQLDDGSPVYVEVEEMRVRDAGRPDGPVTRGGGFEKVGRTSERETPKRFIEAIAHVKPAAEAVLNAFREMNTPNEISLEFGLKFNAKAGAVIASVDSQATMKVCLKWNNEKPATSPAVSEADSGAKAE